MKDQKYQRYLMLDSEQNDMLVAAIDMMEKRFDAKFTYDSYWTPLNDYEGSVTVSRGFTLTFGTYNKDRWPRHWTEDASIKVKRCGGHPELRIAHYTKNLKDITTWTMKIMRKIVTDVPEAGIYLRMMMQIRFGTIPDFLAQQPGTGSSRSSLKMKMQLRGMA